MKKMLVFLLALLLPILSAVHPAEDLIRPLAVLFVPDGVKGLQALPVFLLHPETVPGAFLYGVHQRFLCLYDGAETVLLIGEIAFLIMEFPKLLLIELIIDHRLFHITGVEKHAGIIRDQQAAAHQQLLDVVIPPAR